MVDNQQFIEATDFIKNTKKVTFGQIALAIGIERHILDNIRRGSQAPNKTVIDSFKKIYPESAKFFASKNQDEDIVNDPEKQAAYGDEINRMVLELVETQKKLIEMMEAELEKKRLEVERLRGEVKALRELRK